MRFTFIFFMLAFLLFILTLVSGGAALFAVPLVWLLVLGVPVFVVEAVLTLFGAAAFFTSPKR